MSLALVVGWFRFINNTSTSIASAQQDMINACDIENPNFDIVGTISRPSSPGVIEVIDVKAQVSGKDYHIELRHNSEFAELISIDGGLIQRDGVDGQWQESPFSSAHWLTRLIGSGDASNAICHPLETTHIVGNEVLDKTPTTKYNWAFSSLKQEGVEATDTSPWTHRWEVWLNSNGQIVQIRTTTKDPQEELKDPPSWDIVTSKIVNVGEENIITKPQT